MGSYQGTNSFVLLTVQKIRCPEAKGQLKVARHGAKRNARLEKQNKSAFSRTNECLARSS